jgi:hypothetical protein
VGVKNQRSVVDLECDSSRQLVLSINRSTKSNRDGRRDDKVSILPKELGKRVMARKGTRSGVNGPMGGRYGCKCLSRSDGGRWEVLTEEFCAVAVAVVDLLLSEECERRGSFGRGRRRVGAHFE